MVQNVITQLLKHRYGEERGIENNRQRGIGRKNFRPPPPQLLRMLQDFEKVGYICAVQCFI